MVFTAEQIASLLNGTVEGDASAQVSTFAKIEEGVEGAISFLANPLYEKYIYDTKSTIVLVNGDFVPKKDINTTLIRVDNAYEATAKLMTIYQSMTEHKTGISELAFIHDSAVIGEDAFVAPFACIGKNVVIGKNCAIHSNVVIMDNAVIGDNVTLFPNVTIYNDCQIGKRCVLHAGSVIGADGFGFVPTSEGYEKIPQMGIVVIEDDVEIGANTCIDRSTMGATYVRKGVKLDNLVQIAHNVEVGKHTVMSSQTGVAGSSKIGEWCMLGGQVGIAGHIRVGDKTNIGAQSGVAGGNLAKKGGATMMGYPAVDHVTFAKQAAALKNLPDMIREFTQLKKEVEKLKSKIDK